MMIIMIMIIIIIMIIIKFRMLIKIRSHKLLLVFKYKSFCYHGFKFVYKCWQITNQLCLLPLVRLIPFSEIDIYAQLNRRKKHRKGFGESSIVDDFVLFVAERPAVPQQRDLGGESRDRDAAVSADRWRHLSDDPPHVRPVPGRPEGRWRSMSLVIFFHFD